MKSCPDEVVLSRYFDGEEVGEAANHVMSCLQCQQYLKDLEGLDAVLSSEPSKLVSRRRGDRRWVLAAAPLLLSTGLFWRGLYRVSPPERVQTSSGKSYSVSVSNGVLLSLEIGGESVVRNQK